MDFTLYWFMFPVAMCVATSAMLSGIGGGALFMPIFILIFTLLGTEYPLDSPATAIAVALLTETFGFSSGFVGYYRKRLIDFSLAKTFLYISVPTAIIGAFLLHFINPTIIRGAYGCLVLILAYVLIKGHEVSSKEGYKEDLPAVDGDQPKDRPNNQTVLLFQSELTTTTKDGTVYRYNPYQARLFPTGLGGFLTGLLSVGIGEVVMPQLVKIGKVPVPLAAGASIMVVIITVFSASFTHIATLINEGGKDAVPWNLVVYIIPGVIIGGQIGPTLHGRINSHTMEKFIGILFSIIGVSMLFTVAKDLL